MRWRVSLRAAGLVVVLAAAVQLHAGVMYTVMDLGTLGGTYSYARGINDRGQVVGSSERGGDYAEHAFRTAPNQPINSLTDDLGTLPSKTYSQAYGINNLGQVVGWSGSLPNGMDAHAFRTGPNQAIKPVADNLGTLGGSTSFAYAINDVGQVVGDSWLTGDKITRAFRTGLNQPINPSTDDLGTLAGLSSRAYGINDAGQVVGTSAGHGFRTGPNSPINPLSDDLGTLGGPGSTGKAITASGHIAGTANLAPEQPGFPGPIHIFRTDRNRRINPASDDLGAIGTGYPTVQGMNDGGDIVGWFFAPPDYDHLRAFVCLGSSLFDLNDLILPMPGLELEVAYDINNLGQIVVSGNFNGQSRAYRLDPVPEPSSLLLIASARLLCRFRPRTSRSGIMGADARDDRVAWNSMNMSRRKSFSLHIGASAVE